MKDSEKAEEAIKEANGNDVEKNAEVASRRATRMTEVARLAASESDDPRYAASLKSCAQEVEAGARRWWYSLVRVICIDFFFLMFSCFSYDVSCETDYVTRVCFMAESWR